MSKLRAAFDEERAWLRACDDEGAVHDRMAGYRDNMAFARRVGNAQAHAFAEHLVELAEDRLTMLKVGATKPKARPSAPTTTTRVDLPPPPAEPPARPRAEPVRVDDSAVVRQLQAALAASQEGERRAARERDAADRRAREAGEERDAAWASQRRVPTAEPPTPPSRPPMRTVASLAPPATLPNAASSARATGRANPTTTTRPTPAPSSTASREKPAPPSVQAPTPAAPPRVPQAAPAAIAMPATPPNASPPPHAQAAGAGPALMGADLAAFRRTAGLTQVAAAQRLGVTQGTISKAEGNPRTVLGPALHEALRLAGG